VADISEGLPAGSLAPGSTVAGYVIEERIGAGGMAVVYRARDDVLGRLVAVKVLASALAADEEFRVRFLRESRAVAAVDEPHIVPVYGAGDAGGLLYIATRFVAGGDLSRLQAAAGGSLPPDRAAGLVAQVASALDAAHAIRLVHRDVKPGNILVERIPGRPEHAYLSDFGLSKSTAAGETGLTAAGRYMGTPDYSAPEQVAGGRVDGRADQYSLACVAFSLLAGAAPFGSGDDLSRLYAHVNTPAPALTALRPELPAAVDGVLAKGMAKDPADRYESCAAFASALAEALGVETGALRPAGQAPDGDPVPAPGVPALSGQADEEHQPTVTFAGWQQHPSLPSGGTGPGAADPAPTRPGPANPRRNTSLHIGGAAVAAVLLVAGVIVGVTLSGQHSRTGGAALAASANSASASSAPASSAPAPAASASSAPAAAAPPAAVVNTGTATLVGQLTAPGGELMNSAFFSPDGNYIGGQSPKSDYYVFSVASMKLVRRFSVPGALVYPESFSSTDRTLYTLVTFSNGTNEVLSQDIATGKTINHFDLPAGAKLNQTAYNGSVMDSVAANGTVTEYEMASGKVLATVKNPGSAPVANVWPDVAGSYVVISDTNSEAYYVDALTGSLIATFRYPYSKNSRYQYPGPSRNGETVYIRGGSGRPARLWDLATKSYITPSDPLWPNPDGFLEFSEDSTYCGTSPSGAAVTVDIWDMQTGSHVITVTVPGLSNEFVADLGPSASELLTTGSANISTGDFSKLYVWSTPV
jgi:serine/threonine protein kinase/WD40 repeat protein